MDEGFTIVNPQRCYLVLLDEIAIQANCSGQFRIPQPGRTRPAMSPRRGRDLSPRPREER